MAARRCGLLSGLRPRDINSYGIFDISLRDSICRKRRDMSLRDEAGGRRCLQPGAPAGK